MKVRELRPPLCCSIFVTDPRALVVYDILQDIILDRMIEHYMVNSFDLSLNYTAFKSANFHG